MTVSVQQLSAFEMVEGGLVPLEFGVEAVETIELVMVGFSHEVVRPGGSQG